MAKIQKDGELPFSLPKKKVFIKPVIRSTNWLSFMGGKGHAAAWRQDNAKFTLQIPFDSATKSLVEPLTEKEREFFESDRAGLGYKPGDLLANKFVMDANRNNSILKSFWTRFSYSISKSAGIIDEDTILDTLDLTNPMHYLNYAVLRANIGTFVGTDPNPRTFKASYVLIMLDEDVDDETKATKGDKLAEAFTHYGTISTKPDDLRELLTVAWLEKLTKIKPQRDNKLEWLKAETTKFIQLDNGESYLRVIKNNYKDKVFIHRAMEAGAIKLSAGGYSTDTGMPLGATIDHVIKYLANPQNQELYITITQKIELNN